MIQRIQSIYLLLASGALGAQFALPYATATLTPAEAATPSIFSDGVYNLFDNAGLIGLTGLSAVVGLIAIFLFNNRPMQRNLAMMSALASVLLMGLAFFLFYNAEHTQTFTNGIAYQLGWLFPPLAALLQVLASRAIGKDEKLVRSMDRLR